jgi:ubiquinone/menaquinone biosynthesis C-methylase UbiE
MNIYGLCLQMLATDAAHRSAHCQPSNSSSSSRPNFHTVLQRVGKTVLRPGGTEGTRKLHSWSKLNHDGTAIELSAGMGSGGVALAKATGAHITLTDMDTSRLEMALQIACEQGVDELIETMQLNMRDVDEELDHRHFDTAIIEASMSHYPTKEKRVILEGVSNHADELLLHEICFRCDDASPKELNHIKQDMSRALAIGFHPLTIQGWTNVLDEAGYEVQRMETGPIKILSPETVLQDEGLKRAAKIAWNIATDASIRSRVVETRRTIKSHQNDLGYILIQAVVKDSRRALN